METFQCACPHENSLCSTTTSLQNKGVWFRSCAFRLPCKMGCVTKKQLKMLHTTSCAQGNLHRPEKSPWTQKPGSPVAEIPFFAQSKMLFFFFTSFFFPPSTLKRSCRQEVKSPWKAQSRRWLSSRGMLAHSPVLRQRRTRVVKEQIEDDGPTIDVKGKTRVDRKSWFQSQRSDGVALRWPDSPWLKPERNMSQRISAPEPVGARRVSAGSARGQEVNRLHISAVCCGISRKPSVSTFDMIPRDVPRLWGGAARRWGKSNRAGETSVPTARLKMKEIAGRKKRKLRQRKPQLFSWKFLFLQSVSFASGDVVASLHLSFCFPSQDCSLLVSVVAIIRRKEVLIGGWRPARARRNAADVTVAFFL